MNTFENRGLLTYKDRDGNLHRLYPVTKRECLVGMKYIDDHIADNNNPHNITADQIYAVPIERKINGHALTEDVQLTPSDFHIELDTSLSVEDAYADAKAVGDACKEITSDVLLKHNKAMDMALTAKSIAEHKVSMTPITIELLLDSWHSNQQTVDVVGVTEGNTLIVGNSPENIIEYSNAGVYCLSQNVDKLTFAYQEIPEKDLLVNVIILE